MPIWGLPINCKTLDMIKYLAVIVKVMLIQFLLWGLVCCQSIDSTSLKPDIPVYQDYYVVYNKTQNITEVKATFRKSGVTGVRITLSEDSRVRFNGEAEKEFSILSHYFYSWKTNGFKDVDVVYTKNAGTHFDHTFLVQLAPMVNFANGFFSLDLDGENVFTWQGGAIDTGESIWLTITQNEITTLYSVSTRGAVSLKIAKLKEDGLVKGPAKVELLRKHRFNSLKMNDGGVGGQVNYGTVIEKDIIIQ